MIQQIKLQDKARLSLLAIEQHLLDTNAGKELSWAATDVLLTLVLNKWTTFKYRLALWPPDIYK